MRTGLILHTSPAGVPLRGNNIINKLFSEASSPTICILWLCLRKLSKQLYHCFGGKQAQGLHFGLSEQGRVARGGCLLR